MIARTGIFIMVAAMMLVGCNDESMTSESTPPVGNVIADPAPAPAVVDPPPTVLTLDPAPAPAAPAAVDPPKIQVALLLDNSGSMSGLINQARAQLWAFINEFTTTSKNGQRPTIEVALYIYGDPPATQITALTGDLDLVSEKLFAVSIHGGSEYCGEVIQAAVNELAWSVNPGDLKVIFIAGNEPFTQGEVNYVDACRAAIAKGIVVNTIHCGNEAAGLEGKWDHGARLADGSYMCINQNTTAPQIDAPQDAEILALNAHLNNTYVGFGAAGSVGELRQSEQDTNAASVAPSVAADRVLSKSSAQYRNDSWDLVDAVNNGTVKLEEVSADDLPEAMRSMSIEEQKAYLAEQTQQREDIQARIQVLSKARAAYVAEETKKLVGQDETLQSAVIAIVRQQAEAKDFVPSE